MSDKPNQAEDSDKQVEIWKIKRVCLSFWKLSGFVLPKLACIQERLAQLIKALEAARGNGTSMISLIMPPKDQVRHHAVLHTNQHSDFEACSEKPFEWTWRMLPHR